jgi:polyferredoxin
MPWLGEGVPLCTGGTISRTLSGSWEILLLIGILAILLLVCLLVGRALCGWACPIGFIQDGTSKILKGFKINSYEPPRKVHHKMKYVKYALLFLIFTVAVSIGFSLFINQPMGENYRALLDPMCQTSPVCLGCPTPILRYVFIDIGFNFNPNLSNPSNVFQLGVFLIFLIGMIAIPRFWCRYICPVGALSSLFNKVSFLHLRKDQDKCTKCNYCVDVCPTRVESIMTESEQERIGDLGCTLCGECVEACPEKALTIDFGNKVLYRGGRLWWIPKTHKDKLKNKNN